MRKYLLSSHAFVCLTADCAVFLDVKRDVYSALTRSEADALRPVVHGWPTEENGDGGLGASVDALHTVEALLREGLLTVDQRRGKTARPIALEPAKERIGAPIHPPSAAPVDMFNFVMAWIKVTWMLKFWRFERVVQRQRTLKQRSAGARHDWNVDQARRLVSLYSRWQPLAFSALHACLRNSLTLIEFLARYRIHPTWAFGVRTEPFTAHCWVQHRNALLNDAVEHVRTYTPIMSI